MQVEHKSECRVREKVGWKHSVEDHDKVLRIMILMSNVRHKLIHDLTQCAINSLMTSLTTL